MDFISKLPDDILISIISRISTKDATSTSLLSQRWRSLYRFVPRIELRCCYLLGRSNAEQNPHNSKTNINAVDMFLRLRSSSKIRSLRLSCCLNESVTDGFEQCISSLGRLGIEKFFLECCCSPSISDLSFSCHFFSKMPSLKIFGLSKCLLKPSLGSQCNNFLQNIVLMDVRVAHGAVECILSNCLKLHSLTITSCICPSTLSFCGPRLKLKSLYIKQCEGVEEIEFYASNLVVFEFWSRKFVNLKFDHVPQLQSIFLDILKGKNVSHIWGRLAVDLPCLKSLTFVTRGGDFQESNTPMATNMFDLRRLDIDMHSVPKTNLRLLTSILQSCPLLQEFHLSASFWGKGPPVEKQAIVFHSDLKKMEVSGFCGTKYEIEFALYILRSAINLEKMQISTCFKIYQGPGYWIGTPADPWVKTYVQKFTGNCKGKLFPRLHNSVFNTNPILKIIEKKWRKKIYLFNNLFGCFRCLIGTVGDGT